MNYFYTEEHLFMYFLLLRVTEQNDIIIFQNEIVQALEKHLKIRDSLAIQPLLE